MTKCIRIQFIKKKTATCKLDAKQSGCALVGQKTHLSRALTHSCSCRQRMNALGVVSTLFNDFTASHSTGIIEAESQFKQYTICRTGAFTVVQVSYMYIITIRCCTYSHTKRIKSVSLPACADVEQTIEQFAKTDFNRSTLTSLLIGLKQRATPARIKTHSQLKTEK